MNNRSLQSRNYLSIYCLIVSMYGPNAKKFNINSIVLQYSYLIWLNKDLVRGFSRTLPQGAVIHDQPADGGALSRRLSGI